ncbi:unnamed protein product, partial [Meganyctiphanes norvegica]
MNEMITDENYEDEFECSECDYKCTSENDIMQHSLIHQCPNTSNDDVLDISCYGKYIKDEPNEHETVNLQSKFNSEEAIVSCTKLTDMSKINDLGTYKYKVKRESNSCKVLSTTELHNEIEIGNNRIKLEDIDIDIKQENLPYFSFQKINDYEFIHAYQNSSLMPSKNYRQFNGRKTRPSAYNMNIYTEDGIGGEAESFLKQSKSSQNDIGLTNFSQSLSPHKRHCVRKSRVRKASIEVEVDNTNIYIPPGWKRKVFMRTSPVNNQIRYDCYYYTELGKYIRSKKEAYKYADEGNLMEIDVAKLNFSISQTVMTDQINLEVDLDNTEIYIPEGWKRKIYSKTRSNGKIYYHVNYLNSEGKRFGCISDVYSYVSHSDNIEDMQIDVEAMDFSHGIRNRLRLKKKCQNGQVQDKTMKMNCHQSNAEQDTIINLLFEVRQTFKYNINKLYLCKLCNFSSKLKNTACSHAGKHVTKFSHKSTDKSFLPMNYDYFLCTDCHSKIMIRKDVQVHLQSHCSKQITSNVVGVKFACKTMNNVNKMVYCCEVCKFASFRYSLILKHLKDHTIDEIEIADKDKYHEITNESDENALKAIYKCGNLDDDKKIYDIRSDRKLDKPDISDSKLYNVGTVQHKHIIGAIEIEVDNTGKYIPQGWQRKVYKYKKGVNKGRHVVRYISTFGRTLCSKTQVLEYIERLEGNGIMEPIDVDKLDFSWLSHKTQNKKKGVKEVEVDNTEIYVPEGWQRKLFKITTAKAGLHRGNHFICYISPFNREVQSKIGLRNYLAHLEKQGTPLLVDEKRINFSV